MNVKINERLHIKPVPTILHGGSIWPHQNLTKPQDEYQLTIILEKEIKDNKSLYLFVKLELGHTYLIYLDQVPVGNRLNHGEGKRGLTWPSEVATRHLTRESASAGLDKIKKYFIDLANKSMFKDRNKRAGEIAINHWLFV